MSFGLSARSNVQYVRSPLNKHVLGDFKRTDAWRTGCLHMVVITVSGLDGPPYLSPQLPQLTTHPSKPLGDIDLRIPSVMRSYLPQRLKDAPYARYAPLVPLRHTDKPTSVPELASTCLLSIPPPHRSGRL
jgi:hypothetical protein